MSALLIMPDGNARGVYTEAVDLGALGPLEVRRATAIEFDNRVQAWRVFDAMGDCLYCSPSRETCLAWERKYLDWVLENSQS